MYYKNELFICSECFVQVEGQKFASFLKSKMDVFGDNLKVFCVFDGSLNSLVCSQLFDDRAKVYKFSKRKGHSCFRVIYLDFFALESLLARSQGDSDLAAEKQAKVSTFFDSLHAEHEVLRLEEYIDLDWVQ